MTPLPTLAPAHGEHRERIEQALQRQPAGGQHGLPANPRILGGARDATTASLPGSLGCVDIVDLDGTWESQG